MANTNYPMPSTVEGPCLIQIGSGSATSIFESKEDVKLQIVDETDDISTKTRGTFAQKLKGRRVELKFKPVKWSKFSTLFAPLSLTRGQYVFGSANVPATIWGADGKKVELPRAAITGVPSIGCGVGRELLGEFTLTGLVDPTKAYSDLDSLIKISDGAFPALPALTDADLESAGFIGLLMADCAIPANTDIFVDLEEGAEISFDLKLDERKIDRSGVFDYKFTDLSVSAKFKPMVSDYDNWKKIVSLVASPKLGGIIKPQYDFMIRGLHKDEPVFSLKKIVCSDRTLAYGGASRFEEIEIKAMGNYGIGKFSSSTAAADWAPIDATAALKSAGKPATSGAMA